MRYVSFVKNGKATLGVRDGDAIRVLGEDTLESLLASGVDLVAHGRAHAGQEKVSAEGLVYLPPLARPPSSSVSVSTTLTTRRKARTSNRITRRFFFALQPA